MQYKGIGNNNYTNQLIKWVVIGIDYIVFWCLLYVVVDVIPHSERWDVDKTRIFWLICTAAMTVAEYRFSTVIHQRVLGAGEIIRRCGMLAFTQALLAYLMLRALHFESHLGWQMFFLGLAMTITLIVFRSMERWLLMLLRKKGFNTRFATLIGSDKEMQRLHHELMANPAYGYRLRSSFVSSSDFASRLNNSEELHLGDEVYLCCSRGEHDLIKRTANMCYHRMVKFYYLPPAEEKLNLQPLILNDIEVMTTYSSPLEDPLDRLLKRTCDILLSLVFLIPTILLLPIIAIIIKCQSPGPIFFRQRRTGIDGQEFWCLKFRSMHVNSSADSLQATANDPRLFPFGSFMRRSNIDELPQFWNVLLGSMSIVGPRPHMLSHTEQYDRLIDKYMMRHFVKPGVTGWAQVTGFRGETRELWQMEGRVERDIWYIQHWSIWLDLRIIWMTIGTIFKRDENAY